jgi:hypothetical protein
MPGDDLAGLQPDGFHNPSTVLPNLDCVNLGLYGDILDLACANFGAPLQSQSRDSVKASDSIEGFIEPPAASTSIPELAIVGVGGSDVSEVAVTTERRKKPGTNAFYCVTAGCNLVAKSGRCIRQMCKQHCEAKVGSCPAHRIVTFSDSSLSGTAVSRVPLTNSTVNNLANPKEYRTNMTPAHGELWAKMKEQQQIKIDVKQQRQEYQRIFTQQVIIYAWKSVSWIVVICSWIDEIFRIVRSPLHIGINPFPHGQCIIWPILSHSSKSLISIYLPL